MPVWPVDNLDSHHLVSEVLYSWVAYVCSNTVLSLLSDHIGAEAFLNRSSIGLGVHDLVMSGVNCRGTETMLTSCSSSVHAFHYSYRYAGVHCQPGGLSI